MQRGMELIRAVAFLIAAGSALAAVLCLGGAVSDRLDVLTHLAPFLLAGGLLAVALQAMAGLQTGRATLAMGAVAAVIALGLLAPELIARFTTAAARPGAQTVKVVQFNVWDANRDPAATARWIAASGADVVVLEEAAGAGARVTDDLRHTYLYRSPCLEDGDCATVILSKVAARDGGELSWPGVGPRHVGAWASFGEGVAAFTVAGVHYVWPFPAGRQQAQARRFAQELARFDPTSLIVAGDFNSTPWSFGLRRQDARLSLIRRDRAMATWPGGSISHWRVSFPFPLFAVDHVYAGRSWRTVSVERGPCLGSDHYPITVVLTR